MAAMQARKMAANETVGNHRQINGVAPVGFIGRTSIRRGSVMSLRSVSSKPAGAGDRGALRSNCSIRSSFIISSFVQAGRSVGTFVWARRNSSASRRRYFTVLVATPNASAVSCSDKP